MNLFRNRFLLRLPHQTVDPREAAGHVSMARP